MANLEEQLEVKSTSDNMKYIFALNKSLLEHKLSLPKGLLQLRMLPELFCCKLQFVGICGPLVYGTQGQSVHQFVSENM